jgi:GAF domain-containing protein
MQFDPGIHSQPGGPETDQFRTIVDRLNQKLQRDQLVQDTTDSLRQFLNVDRVVLYHFYNEWEGRVTFEALSEQKWSIFGSTGPAQCFTDEYAALYLAGRVRSIEDIQTEAIAPCHRDFLAELHVRANLVVPILTQYRLWGLLVAHHCQHSRAWAEPDITRMKEGALTLATAPSINTP